VDELAETWCNAALGSGDRRCPIGPRAGRSAPGVELAEVMGAAVAEAAGRLAVGRFEVGAHRAMPARHEVQSVPVLLVVERGAVARRVLAVRSKRVPLAERAPGLAPDGGEEGAVVGTSPRWKIALLSRIVRGSGETMARLAEAGVEVVVDLEGYEAMAGDPGAWDRVLSEIDALVVGLQPVDEALLQRAGRLRYVLRIGTGLDNVDLPAARARGVEVAGLAGRNAEAVAELAFGLLLSAARDIAALDASVRAGRWERRTGRHLGGRTLGLVGFGDIARAMVPKAHGFGMDLVVHRRSPGPVDVPGVRAVTLDELVATSDFVSVHVPLTPETRHLIGRREIGRMRGTVLVNTARGEVVDEAALVEGLRSGRVAACGLDVFADEPPVGSPLLSMDHVVLSPHNGAYSDRAVEEVAAAAADALLGALGAAPR